jgi:two-component system, sensor histidine kinase and response regulator
MASEPKVILNVDDYPPARYARTRLLANAGFTVREAATGQEALQAVARDHPHLVVLDVNLPDIDGLAVCQRIKGNPSTASTLVLHLSASAVTDQSRASGLENGADSYLTEPVAPEVLIATIRALIRARSAEDALRRSNDELQHFALTIAHELNEPLRTINSYVQLLANRHGEGLGADALEYIRFTQDAAVRMRRFIDELLSYSQIARGGGDRHDLVSMDHVLATALHNLVEAVGASGAEVTSEPLPPVIGSEGKLVHVLQNLIGNAIKYRRDEPPRVHVAAAVSEECAVFSVRDNGQGIEPQYLEEIFGMFKRLHGREYSGSGIGLALSKRVVEQHGGRMWAESEVGAGSVFFFTLPAAPGRCA